MNTESFVNIIKLNVRDAAIDDTISKLIAPPGRKVSPQKKVLSAWYNGLSTTDLAHVEHVIQNAINEAVFGFFAVLDGTRIVGDGSFELIHTANEVSVLLNDPNSIGFNEIFNSTD